MEEHSIQIYAEDKNSAQQNATANEKGGRVAPLSVLADLSSPSENKFQSFDQDLNSSKTCFKISQKSGPTKIGQGSGLIASIVKEDIKENQDGYKIREEAREMVFENFLEYIQGVSKKLVNISDTEQINRMNTELDKVRAAINAKNA